jgi:hypothetical protein
MTSSGAPNARNSAWRSASLVGDDVVRGPERPQQRLEVSSACVGPQPVRRRTPQPVESHVELDGLAAYDRLESLTRHGRALGAKHAPEHDRLSRAGPDPELRHLYPSIERERLREDDHVLEAEASAGLIGRQRRKHGHQTGHLEGWGRELQSHPGAGAQLRFRFEVQHLEVKIPDLEASIRARPELPRRSRRIARCLADELAVANDGLGRIDLEGTGVARFRAREVRFELEPTFERHLLELEPGPLHDQVRVDAGGARSSEASVHGPGHLPCEGVGSCHVAGRRSEVDSLETSVDLGVAVETSSALHLDLPPVCETRGDLEIDRFRERAPPSVGVEVGDLEDERWRHAAIFELDLGIANPQR